MRLAAIGRGGSRRVALVMLAAGGGVHSAHAETVYAVTQYSYDQLNRVQCTTVRMDSTQWAGQTNVCTPQTTSSNGSDRVSENSYDAAGQTLQVIKAVGTPQQQPYVTYAYSPNGKQTDAIDANGNHSQFVYDGFDRLVQWRLPSVTKATAYNGSSQANALSTANAPDTNDYEAYTYDANGNRQSLRKRDTSVLTYYYDSLNRLTNKAIPQRGNLPATDARSVFYSYDLMGHQLTAWFDSASSGQGITNTYDVLGRLSTTNQALDSATRTLKYGWDGDGNRTLVTFPDSNSNYVTYQFDGLDRPTLIQRLGSSTIAAYTYASTGLRTGFNNNVTAASATLATSYQYDPIDRLLGLSNTPKGNTTYSNSYGFAYTPANQLAAVAKTNNLFVFSGTANQNRPYTTNGLNEYAKVGTANYAYDGNGNLTGDGTNTFLYDIENRLVGETNGAGTAAVRYDPLGRLYEVSGPGSTGTTRFLYGGDELMAEYDSSGNLLRRYVHGADLKSDDPIAWYEGSTFTGSSERFLRPNWQGSVELVTDNVGSTIYAANTYDEYGIPGTANAGRFQFTGQAWMSELGMNYYKARMYSPILGRFMQTDPVGYKDNFNLYAYVNNDPTDRTDPEGTESACITMQSCPGMKNASAPAANGSVAEKAEAVGKVAGVGGTIADVAKLAVKPVSVDAAKVAEKGSEVGQAVEAVAGGVKAVAQYKAGDTTGAQNTAAQTVAKVAATAAGVAIGTKFGGPTGGTIGGIALGAAADTNAAHAAINNMTQGTIQEWANPGPGIQVELAPSQVHTSLP